MDDSGTSWSFESAMGLLFMAAVVAVIVYAAVSQSRKSRKAANDYVSNCLANLQVNSFQISNQYVYGHLMLFIDDVNKKWAISTNQIPLKIYGFDDLNHYDLDEDGNTLTQETIRGRVTAYKGFGLLRPSAVVKASTQQHVTNICSKLQLRIFIDDVQLPQVVIDFIGSEVDKSSGLYRTSYQKAYELVAILEYIKNNSLEAASIENQSQTGIAGDDTKECPRCAERIKARALVCRFCGHQFGNMS